jgi:glucan phosphoethanolaminetransferase (alkaline phosphatase superfamily)
MYALPGADTTNRLIGALVHCHTMLGIPSIQVVNFEMGGLMIFSLDIWLLPAIAAGSSSYLVCILWERYRKNSAPNWFLSIFLAALSFLMGAVCTYYRYIVLAPSLENNVIVMFIAGASTTFFWLLLRKHFPRPRKRDRI